MAKRDLTKAMPQQIASSGRNWITRSGIGIDQDEKAICTLRLCPEGEGTPTNSFFEPRVAIYGTHFL